MSLKNFNGSALWRASGEPWYNSGRFSFEREGTDAFVRLSEKISIYDGRILWLIIRSSPAVRVKGSRGAAVSVLGDGESQIQCLDSHLDRPCWSRWS